VARQVKVNYTPAADNAEKENIRDMFLPGTAKVVTTLREVNL